MEHFHIRTFNLILQSLNLPQISKFWRFGNYEALLYKDFQSNFAISESFPNLRILDLPDPVRNGVYRFRNYGSLLYNNLQSNFAFLSLSQISEFWASRIQSERGWCRFGNYGALVYKELQSNFAISESLQYLRILDLPGPARKEVIQIWKLWSTFI